jgi:CHAD domain-containing protein
LRYILELYEDADPAFIKTLGRVKDQIGDWHDWDELAKTANDVLDAKADRELLEKIDEIGKKKLKAAMRSAKSMQEHYLKHKIELGTRKPPLSVSAESVSLDTAAVPGIRQSRAGK